MPKLKLRQLGIIALSLILLTNLLLFVFSQTKPQWLRGKATIGHPYLFTEQLEYLSSITDFAVSGNYLYVLFQGKGVLACYDLHGTYIHSYAFDMSKNGQAQLYTQNNKLYLESSEHGLYCFENGIFTDYEKPELAKLASIKESLGASTLADAKKSSVQYQLRGASIWRIDENKSVEILHRSKWLILFQGYTQLVIHILCIILLFLLSKQL